MFLFIHGWLNLEDVIFVGMVLTMFSTPCLKSSHRMLMGVFGSNFVVNSHDSLSAWRRMSSRSACFQSCMILFGGRGLYGLTLVFENIFVSCSLIPGRGSSLLTSDGLFVRKRSSVLSILVGNSTSCCRLRS